MDTNTAQPAQTKSFVDKIWDFFASIKLAAVTFALIALSSIVGTILEQQAAPAKNLQLLGKMFGDALAPKLYDIFYAMGFMDMYHSWWFMAFLVIFSVNLIVCSLDRLPAILKIIKQPIMPLKKDRFGAYSIKHDITLKSGSDAVKNLIRNSLRKAGFNAQEITEEGMVQFYSQKGGYSRLGVYVTHLSILLIFIGAVIGIFFGFNGYLNLPEGFTSEVAYARQGGKAQQLDFIIKCDDFDVEYYRESDMPKDYKSWLKVINKQTGNVELQKVIEVNEPLRFNGYTFYQSSYGLMPEGQGVREIVFNVISNTGASNTVRVEPGGSFTIPGTDIKGTVKDYSPALAFRQDGSTYTYGDMMTNPAVFLVFTQKGKEIFSGWILKRFPRTWDLPDNSRIEFVDLWGAQYTGLQVRKDPGVWIVYLGCIVMGIGLFSTFFMSHKKIWIALIPGEGKLLVAATANKNRPGFERKIESMITTISKNIEEE